MAIDRRRNLGLPSGVVFPFAGVTAPYGYLICDGRAVSRTDYPVLFSAIGTSHGIGDGSLTFNLPDYRGRFLRGLDGTAGNDPDKATRTAMGTGGNSGNAVGSVQADDFYSHTHIQNPHQHSLPPIATANTNGVSLPGSGNQGAVNTGLTTATNQNTGGNETRPKNVNVNYIIKI